MYAFDSSSLTAVAELCRQFQVRELLVFGSAARDDFDPERSDIDLLVEFEPEARIGLFRYAELQQRLAELLGRKVDLISKRGLKAIIRDEVLSQARLCWPPNSHNSIT